MAPARSTPKNLIEKLADAGEEAIAKIAEAPGVGRVVEGASGMKDRLDELQLRVRGLEGIEKRVQELERKVEELSKASKPAPARPSAAPAAPTRPTPKPNAPAVKKPGAVPGP
jgi:hypothetical protein